MLCLEQCWKYILRKSLATLLALALEAPYLKLSAGFLHYLNHPGVCHGLCGGVGLLDGQRTKHGGDTWFNGQKERRKIFVIHGRFVARTTIPVERMLQRHWWRRQEPRRRGKWKMVMMMRRRRRKVTGRAGREDTFNHIKGEGAGLLRTTGSAFLSCLVAFFLG